MGPGIGSVAVKLNGYLPSFAQFNVGDNQSDFCGHTYKVVSRNFKIFSELTNVTDSFHYVLQFIVGAATVVTRGTVFRGFHELRRINSFIDCVRTYGDVHYFVEGKYLEDLRSGCVPGFISSSLFLGASIGSCLNVMDRVRLINTSAIAESLSKVSLFGSSPFRILSVLALSEFCLFAATGAFLLGAIDCGMKIQAGDLSTSRLAQLAYCIATFVAQLFVITGQCLVAAPLAIPIAGSLAMISSGFGAWWIWQTGKEKA
jgi:hypothetical protein